MKIIKVEHEKKNLDTPLRIIVDGAQAVGKIDCNIKDCDIDYFTFTAHKVICLLYKNIRYMDPKELVLLVLKKKELIA